MSKPQRKGKNTEQVNRPVSFNLLDPDQKADYEFTQQWFNFSGKVKEWIRAQRLGKQTGFMLPLGDDGSSESMLLPEMDDVDALSSIV